MRFRIDRDTLTDATTYVAKTLPARAAVPILAGILIETNGARVAFSTFDYEQSSNVVANAEVDNEGKVVVSGKLLADIVKSLPKKPVDITVTSNQVEVLCGTAKFTLPIMTVDDYPTLPTAPATTGTIPADLFNEVVAQVTVAAGKDDTLPMLTGVKVESEGNTVTLAATDRFRLAVRTFEWDGDTVIDTLVPAQMLAAAGKTYNGDTPVNVAFGDKQRGIFAITGRDRTTTTRLLDVEFPRFRQLLPAEHTAVATVNIPELIGAIKRVALVSERGAQVRMQFTAGIVTLTAGSSDSGSAEEALDADFEGEPFVIAFNPGYLTDGLNSLNAARVLFGFTTPARPAVLYPAVEVDRGEGGTFPAPVTAYRYLLMPVRIPA